ncbi:hypothetical protein [Aeromonas caviae]|uniref:hypothetical protein n=1 Tax=Aeromonas caviae TaxID=648 RepID=UPI00398CAA47
MATLHGESIKQAKKNNPFISLIYVFITFNTHHLGARCPVTGGKSHFGCALPGKCTRMTQSPHNDGANPW